MVDWGQHASLTVSMFGANGAEVAFVSIVEPELLILRVFVASECSKLVVLASFRFLCQLLCNFMDGPLR